MIPAAAEESRREEDAAAAAAAAAHPPLDPHRGQSRLVRDPCDGKTGIKRNWISPDPRGRREGGRGGRGLAKMLVADDARLISNRFLTARLRNEGKDGRNGDPYVITSFQEGGRGQPQAPLPRREEANAFCFL